MNGKLMPTLAGLILGALITGLVSMTMFGRQLERVETKVISNGESINEIKQELRDHQIWHMEQK